mmetsp:Transcript_5390/g.6555  ORF Transcript_5390/g.6555 Transcript_5390/m.6555 type:complete len:87 (-) Transcript_5390:112-372(-)
MNLVLDVGSRWANSFFMVADSKIVKQEWLQNSKFLKKQKQAEQAHQSSGSTQELPRKRKRWEIYCIFRRQYTKETQIERSSSSSSG